MKHTIFARQNKCRKYISRSVLAVLFLLTSIIVLIQCAEIPEIRHEIPDLTGVDILSPERLLNRLLEGEPPISTSIKDAVYEDSTLDNFNPTNFAPMAEMPRTQEGGFFLLPGLYSFEAQSYCLEAGSYSPRSGGPGYIYAPLKGSKSEIVRHILERSLNHPKIEQRDIQVLLWAIIAKTKISDMSLRMQRVAATLLTREELFELNGAALGLIPDEVFLQAIEKLPKPMQQVLEAEQRLRQMLSEATDVTYEELEDVAVITGIEPQELLVRDIPLGRWSKHPDGYHIRYFPLNYSHTRIEVYVPESALRAGNPHKRLPRYNPSGGGAVPGNTGSQRLGLSGRKSSDADSPLEKARKATRWINIGSSILGFFAQTLEKSGREYFYINSSMFD